VLIFSERRASIVRIPAIALILLGPWALIEVSALAGGAKHSAQVTWGFAAAVCAAFALGFRIIRRVGDQIVSTGLRGSRSVPARHAVVGIRMWASSKYAQLGLDVMAHPDFDQREPDPLRIDSFAANGTGAAVRAGRRSASLLGLAGPMLAPGLSEDAIQTPASPDGIKAGERFDLRRQVLDRWAALDGWSKFLSLIALLSVIGVASRSFLRPGAQLHLRCAQSWQVRDPAPTFNFTCLGKSEVVSVDPGPGALEVWDPSRGCWVERRFVVPERGAIGVDVDRTVKASPCAKTALPPPP
jgi:hypothetical protein